MASPQVTGGGYARTPTRFCAIFFKSPLNWPKYAHKLAPEPPAPPPFSNPGSAPDNPIVP